jgi:hypothetical protein
LRAPASKHKAHFSVIAVDGLDGESTMKFRTESLLSCKAVAAGNSAILYAQKRVWSFEHADLFLATKDNISARGH